VGLASLEVHPCQEFLGCLKVLWVLSHHGPHEHLCLWHRTNPLFLPYGLEDLADQPKPTGQKIKKQEYEHAEQRLCFLEMLYEDRTQ